MSGRGSVFNGYGVGLGPKERPHGVTSVQNALQHRNFGDLIVPGRSRVRQSYLDEAPSRRFEEKARQHCMRRQFRSSLGLAAWRFCSHLDTLPSPAPSAALAG
ncbi:MAG: hypothetical protein Q9172_002081 [Xanthocarpia lactea]